MKPSSSKAAKQGGVNSGLAKMYGQPFNASTCTGGGIAASSKAGSRPAVNSSIVGMKYGESPNDYGKGV